jgi:hypothetical protein
MRFLMKITLPPSTENALVDDPEFREKLRSVFMRIGAQATYSNLIDGRRIEYVLVDIEDLSRIADKAEPVFRFLGVKPEFLPEVVPKPYYGRVGY